MKRLLFACGTFLVCAGLVSAQSAGGPSPRALLDRYCVTCHNDKLKTAGLTLDKMDLAHVDRDTEAWEKAVRKLRAGMMPPQGLPRPAAPEYEGRTLALDNELDRAAAAQPKLSAP